MIDHEPLVHTAAEVAEAWAEHADPLASQAENARRLAPRLGMTPEALARALQRMRTAA